MKFRPTGNTLKLLGNNWEANTESRRVRSLDEYIGLDTTGISAAFISPSLLIDAMDSTVNWSNTGFSGFNLAAGIAPGSSGSLVLNGGNTGAFGSTMINSSYGAMDLGSYASISFYAKVDGSLPPPTVTQQLAVRLGTSSTVYWEAIVPGNTFVDSVTQLITIPLSSFTAVGGISSWSAITMLCFAMETAGSGQLFVDQVQALSLVAAQLDVSSGISGTAVETVEGLRELTAYSDPTFGQLGYLPSGIGAAIFGQELFFEADFNGTSDEVQYGFDLSANSKVTIVFWLWQNAFDNLANKIVLEYGATMVNPGAFTIMPDDSGGGFAFVMGFSGGFWGDSVPRPSAAAWHHYVVVFDRAGPTNTVYVDGVLQTLTSIGHTAGSYGNFANYNLNVMARNGSSLFNAGKMVKLGIFDQSVTLTQDQINLLAGARPMALETMIGVKGVGSANPVEPGQGVKQTGLDPLEAAQKLALTGTESVEATKPVQQVGSADPLEANKLLKAAGSADPLEANQGVKQTGLGPLEAAQKLAVTGTESVESTKPVKAVGSVDPLEAAQIVKAIGSVDPFESLKALAATGLLPFEIVKSLAAIGSADPVEAAQIVKAVGSVYPVESLKGLAGVGSSDPVEALQALANTSSLATETLKALLAQNSEPFELARALAASSSLPLEAAQKLAALGGLNAESLTALLAQLTFRFEAVQGLAAVISAPLEAAKRIAANAAMVLEGSKQLAVTGTVDAEALKQLAVLASAPYESLGITATGVSQHASLALEALVGVARSNSAPAEVISALRAVGLAPLDAAQQVHSAGTGSVEALRSVSAVSSPAVLEVLLGIRSLGAADLESLQTLHLSSVVAAESLGRLASEISGILETLVSVVSSSGANAESLISVRSLAAALQVDSRRLRILALAFLADTLLVQSLVSDRAALASAFTDALPNVLTLGDVALVEVRLVDVEAD